jgi:AcrR family transcriptional regulator
MTQEAERGGGARAASPAADASTGGLGSARMSPATPPDRPTGDGAVPADGEGHRDNPWIADLEWVRIAHQDRGRRTQFRLLDALERLLNQRHLEDISVGDIVAEASSSVGAFYHHFPDKHALVQALLERSAHEFRATCRNAVDPERWRDATILDVMQGYLEFSLDENQQRSGIHRAERVLAFRDPVVHTRLQEKQRQLDEGVGALLLERVDEIGHPNPTLAIPFVLRQTRATFASYLAGAPDGTRTPRESPAEFVAETLRSIQGYLALSPTRRTTS